MAKPKISPKVVARRKLARKAKKALIWLGVLSIVGALVYAIGTSSAVPYDEDDIAVVDFSTLTAAQKTSALRAANAAPCTCGCGLKLAQCVATDSTCPVRSSNIERIRTMVEQAKGS